MVTRTASPGADGELPGLLPLFRCRASETSSSATGIRAPEIRRSGRNLPPVSFLYPSFSVSYERQAKCDCIGRMKIATHYTAVLNPVGLDTKTAAGSRLTKSTATLTAPNRPGVSNPGTTTAPTSSFTSLFQNFAQASAASLAQSQASMLGTSSASSGTGTSSTSGTSGTSSGTSTSAPATGIGALVAAMLNGSFKATYVTDPSQLQETSPAGTNTMPNFYYASDQTAQQMAQLLGGTVVQMKAFGQDKGWTEPNANFIELPNGQTFNAADVAYYARNPQGTQQLTAAITQTINQGSAWTNYYQSGGPQPIFPAGYIGPPISGMTYPSGTLAADGSVINPFATSMPAT